MTLYFKVRRKGKKGYLKSTREGIVKDSLQKACLKEEDASNHTKWKNCVSILKNKVISDTLVDWYTTKVNDDECMMMIKQLFMMMAIVKE